MSTTNLKITIKVGGQIPIVGVPTRAQLSATSTLTLKNGSFSQSVGGLKLTVDPGVPIKVEFDGVEIVTSEGEFPGNSRSVSITVMGGLTNTTPWKSVVFPTTTMVLEGLTVEMEGDLHASPIALIGTMTHTVNTGTFVVASTGNPQGDALPSNVESREMALVP